MDENNNTNQDLELKKLLDQYSNEVNKSSQTEETESSLNSGFDSQIPQKAEESITPNFETQTEQQPEMIQNQEMEPSLGSGFNSEIPSKTENIVNGFENQTPRNDFVNEPVLENTMPYQKVGKKFNFFKFLFIISLLIFLGVLASIAYILINSQKTEEIIETNNITITPTETPTPEVTVVPTVLNTVPVVQEAIAPTATPTATLEVTKVPTPVLKTYKNTKYKLSFQYPQNWTIKAFSPTGDQIKTYDLFISVLEPENVRKKDFYKNDIPSLFISLIDLKKVGMTFDEYIKDQISANLLSNISDAKINNLDAKHATLQGYANSDAFLIEKNNIVYELSRSEQLGEPFKIEDSNVKVILDTFKLN